MSNYEGKESKLGGNRNPVMKRRQYIKGNDRNGC